MLHVSTKVEQGAVVLELSGRFDFHVMEKFVSALDQAKESHLPQYVVLDVSQVNFIDSMAIGRIVATYKRLKKSAIRLALAGQHGEVDDALKAINLDAMVPTFATVEEAITSSS